MCKSCDGRIPVYLCMNCNRMDPLPLEKLRFEVGQVWKSSTGRLHTILSTSAKGKYPIVSQCDDGPPDRWTKEGYLVTDGHVRLVSLYTPPRIKTVTVYWTKRNRKTAKIRGEYEFTTTDAPSADHFDIIAKREVTLKESEGID